MKKTLTKLLYVGVCAPFIFVACTAKTPSQSENSTPPQYVELPNESPNEPPSIPPATDATENLEYWDLSDVDVSQIAQDKKLVSFSFDDAPGKTLENILAVFATFNENNPDCIATATLFCNGQLIHESSSRTLSMATLLGWELGNHTYSHCDLALLPDELLEGEIEKTQALLQKVDGKARHLFRAPYGRITEEAKAAANAPVFNWTIDTLDWTGVSAEDIYNAVMTRVYPGAIVLMHDGYAETVRALKRLLPDLKSAGYQVTGISQMAKAHNCKLKNGSEYIRCRPQN